MSRVAFWGMLAAAFAIYALVAWWTPINGGDWSHELWAAHHADLSGVAWWKEFLSEYWRLGSFVSYGLVRAPLAHVVLTPVVGVSLVIGLYTLARHRLPRPSSWTDVLDVAVLSALIWMAAPRAGLVWFYRAYTAPQLYGCAVAVWFLVAVRCERLPRPVQLLAGIAGLLAGTVTPQIAIPTTIACILFVRRAPRPIWKLAAAVAVTGSTLFMLSQPPLVEVRRMLTRSLATTLDVFTMPVKEGGELLSLVAALVLVTLVLAKISAKHEGFVPDEADRPELARSLRIGVLGIVLCVFAMFGPFYTDATLFPAMLVLCIAALPFVRVVARDRWMRIVVTAMAAGVHLVVWAMALSTYHVAGAEYADRIERLEHAPKDSVAIVPPYSQTYPDFWFAGEDWYTAADREAIARALFGLRDIDIFPTFRGLERNPGIELVFESDAAPDAQKAAGVPAQWPRSLAEAVRQFDDVAARVKPAPARLRVTNVTFPELAGRPLLVAWSEGSDLVTDAFSVFGPDPEDRYWVSVPEELTNRLPEAWVVQDGAAVRAKLDKTRVMFQPMVVANYAAVICDPRRCLLVSAFIPRF